MPNTTLDALIASYVDAVDGGGTPERERIIADHPEFANALRDFFADFDRMRVAINRAEEEGKGNVDHASSSVATEADDLRLREEIELNRNPDDQPGDTFPPAASGAASTVIDGKYKLLQKIGEGGMGEVWMAEQEQPIKRRVALKLIKSGMNSREVIARFEAERQALALMDHQNIAKVLDGGSTTQGQPYFVMELVPGTPITSYCDQNNLSIRERIELFQHVCNAVQHAHQKGIIHRDLKPSNILVALCDGQPIVKVIDFGLAKALQHHGGLTNKTLFTEFGKVVGTLIYMSPEQAEPNTLDIDTRSDVYSLGVVLYELLTGTTPLEKGEVNKQALLKVIQMIQEEDPVKPSQRLSTKKEHLVTASAQRQIVPKKLTQVLRGELDWIVMKALERERKRRYESPSQLALDLQRYASGEPVHARPHSWSYSLKKYAVKHRGWVASMAAVALAIVIGSVGSLYFALAEQHARKQADMRGQRLKNSITLLESVFNDINPFTDELGDANLRERLKGNLQQAASQLRDSIVIGESDLETDIPLLLKIAQTLSGLGLDISKYLDDVRPFVDEVNPKLRDTVLELDLMIAAEAGIADYSKVVDRVEAIYGPKTLKTLEAKSVLAFMHSQSTDTSSLKFSAKLYEDLIPLAKELGNSSLLIKVFHDSSFTYAGLGDSEKAIQFLEQSIELLEVNRGLYHIDTLIAKRTLAGQYRLSADHFLEAKPLLEEISQLSMEHHGRWHRQTCRALMDLMIVCAMFDDQPGYLQRAKEVIPDVENSYEYTRRSLGDDHPETLTLLNNLASAYGILGELGKCIEMHSNLVEKKGKQFGVNSEPALLAKRTLAIAYKEDKQMAKAAELMSEYASFANSTYGPDDERTKEAQMEANLWRIQAGIKSIFGE